MFRPTAINASTEAPRDCHHTVIGPPFSEQAGDHRTF
jgi:hypothetical protein